MRKEFVCFLFCSFALGNIFCRAQNSKADSLITFVGSAKPDTFKVNALNELAYELRSRDPEKAIAYGREADQLGTQLKFDKGAGLAKINIAVSQINIGEYDQAIENANRGIELLKQYSDKFNEGRAYNTIGEANRYKDNYNEALKYYQIALKIRTEMADKKGIASVLNNIGIIQFNLGNYPESLRKHLEALKLREEAKDLQAVAASYNNIALVYLKQLNFSEALRYHDLALKIRTTLDDKRGMATSYTNIANIQRLSNELPKALENYQQALKIFEGLGDKKNIAGSYNNIGSIYQIEADTLFARKKNAEGIKKINDAIENYTVASKMYDEIQSSSGAILIFQNMGNANRTLKKYSLARSYYLSGLDLAMKIGSKEEVKNFYLDLSNTDLASGDYKRAFENHKLYIVYRDSLDNEETRKKTVQTQMTYEFEKKEAVAEAEHKKELENQEKLAGEKSRKQKMVIAFVLGGLLLVVIFAIFIFRSLHITRKQKALIEEQKKLVEDQKNEVEEQKSIIEEKQKEIIDSIMYARRIQRSLLPTQRYIEQTLNRLKK